MMNIRPDEIVALFPRGQQLRTPSYRGTSIVRNSAPLGPYSKNMPRPLWRPEGGGVFLMSEVALYSQREWDVALAGVGRGYPENV